MSAEHAVHRRVGLVENPNVTQIQALLDDLVGFNPLCPVGVKGVDV